MAGSQKTALNSINRPNRKKNIPNRKKLPTGGITTSCTLGIAVIAVVLVVWMVHDVVTQVRPDYRVGYVGSSNLPTDTVTAPGKHAGRLLW